MSEPVIRVENIGKRYSIGSQLGQPKSISDTVQGYLQSPTRLLQHFRIGPPTELLWAIKDVSFDVYEGEVVGIIGRNGAGKSTLLKVLARITEPTEGQATIRGKVSSLLEVGIGFHPDLTGRENIYLYGVILGMTKVEIDRKFDEIVAFGGVEKFIDTPMKHYSSGMYVRLAFAVAAHVEPDVLLIDEVLAVGDAAFQNKCLGRIDAISKEGRTVLFVSHNIPALLSLCSRAILLSGGTVTADGKTREVLDTYLEGIKEKSELPLFARKDRRGDQRLKFVGFEMRDWQGVEVGSLVSGQDVTLALKYESSDGEPLNNVHVELELYGKFHESLCQLSTNFHQVDFQEIPAAGAIELKIPRLPLQAGRYMFDLYATVSGGMSDYIQDAGALNVEPGDFFGSGRLPPVGHGIFLVQHSWSVASAEDCSQVAYDV
jgi:lipopolysaccharide transport system ATP-binding protein